MSAATRFCVVLCTHNGAEFIDEQLRSLSEQSLLPLAIEAHDWGSTDDTCARIEAWARNEATGWHFELYRHDAAPGPCASFLAALEHALGEHPDATHFLFCDQDDVWSTERLQCYAETIAAAGVAPDLLFSDLELIAADGAVLNRSFYGEGGSPYRQPVSLESPDIALVSPVVGMSACLSRRLAELLIGYRDLPWAMHDWAAVLLLRLHEMPWVYLPRVLGSYRQHSRNQRGAPSADSPQLKLRRMRRRLARLRQLRRELAQRAPDHAHAGERIFPRGRFQAAWMLLRSRNLKCVYRGVSAAATLLLW